MCLKVLCTTKIYLKMKLEGVFFCGLQRMSDSKNKWGVLNPMCRHLNPCHLI